MKTINVSFEDAEMEAIKEAKGEQSWHDFIFDCVAIKHVFSESPLLKKEKSERTTDRP